MVIFSTLPSNVLNAAQILEALAAFDEACAAVGAIDHDDRTFLALAVMTTIGTGVFDRQRLVTAAIDAWRTNRGG